MSSARMTRKFGFLAGRAGRSGAAAAPAASRRNSLRFGISLFVSTIVRREFGAQLVASADMVAARRPSRPRMSIILTGVEIGIRRASLVAGPGEVLPQ